MAGACQGRGCRVGGVDDDGAAAPSTHFSASRIGGAEVLWETSGMANLGHHALAAPFLFYSIAREGGPPDQGTCGGGGVGPRTDSEITTNSFQLRFKSGGTKEEGTIGRFCGE